MIYIYTCTETSDINLKLLTQLIFIFFFNLQSLFYVQQFFTNVIYNPVFPIAAFGQKLSQYGHQQAMLTMLWLLGPISIMLEDLNLLR